jgi:hypothetical protein
MFGKADVSLLVILAAAACGTDPDPTAPLTLSFGPYTLNPGQELTDTCVSTTLHNDQPIYINSVELQAATGIHHSNWFWVPEFMYPGSDGQWSCTERGFNEGIAGLKGGVLFAMSTQATHETQAFPAGAVIKVPPHSKIVAGLHLLNAGDTKLSVPLSLVLRPIAEADVVHVLAGLSFENESIALPPHLKSRFTVECDLGPKHEALFGRPVDFKLYYALPHYHALGIGETFEAIRDSDGGSDMIWETANKIGDRLGGTIDPPFDLTGHSKLRFACEFDNPRDVTVGWGVGDQEMCIIVAYTDSTYTWGGGVVGPEDPGPGVAGVDGVVDFIAPTCQVLVADAEH